MENQWKIPMEFQGKPCGQAAFCREGLYLQVTCDCENVTDQVVRAYLEGPEDRLALGVLVPENGMLHLCRRIPASHLRDREYTCVRVSGGEEDGWKPWEGLLEGQPVSGALSRMEHGRQMLALPFVPGEPFAAAGQFRDSTPAEINGQLYLIIPAALQEETLQEP